MTLDSYTEKLYTYLLCKYNKMRFAMKNIFFLTTFCLFLVASISLGQGAPWITKAPMPTPRMALSTSVVDGIIYVIGGTQDFHQPAIATVEAYDPETDSWTSKAPAPMPTLRAGLSTCVVDGIIYAIGGARDVDSQTFSTMEAYDPATNTWTPKRDMPTPRGYPSTSVVDGIIYAIGGGSDTESPLSTVEAYDPVTNTWITKTDMPTARSWLSSSTVDGKIYAIGGLHGGGPIATVEEYDPSSDPTSVQDLYSEQNPMEFSLHQNYPNPFNPNTTINFEIPKTSKVTLKVFNILGEEVATLVSDRLTAGSYSYNWDASNLTSGVYLYRLETGDFVETKKMILMK